MIKLKKRSLAKISIILFVVIFISGCGLWNNFTTYFNRYYNTKKAFNEAEKIIKEDRKELFNYKEPLPPQQADKLLTSVIEKGSNILQFDSESAYVDDALFMVGKAFYYQQNYSKALRKFRELQALSNSDFELENSLWIGKTQLKLRNFEAGLEILDQVKIEAAANEKNEILRDAYIAEISYHLYRENYENAVTLMNDMIAASDDEEINAEVSYELGKVYLKTEDLENAAKAFAAVNNYSPNYEIEYSSNLEYAKTLKQMGRTEESLELFRSMRNEDKNSDHFDAIDLQIAGILYDRGEINEAYDKYTIVDTTYTKSESSGIAKFRRAEIWENDFDNLDSAKFFYDKVRSTSAPNEYKSRSAAKIQKLNKYFSIKSEQERYNQQLEYINNPESFVRDSIAYAEYQEEVVAQAQSSDLPQRGRGERQPNSQQQQGNQRNKNIPTMPVKTSMSADSLQTLLNKTYYELGNFFYSEIIRSDSAFYYYKKVVDNEDSQNRPKAMYAMGTYYLSNGQEEKADSIFNYIYDNYKNLDIVNEAARQLGKEEIALNVDPAEDAYLAAENKFDNEEYDAALSDLKNIYLQYPESPFAAKAMYTTGWLYENKLDQPDSAAAIYDSLTVHYNNTQYARAVTSKLNTYIEENTVKPEPADSTIPAIQTERDSILVPDSQIAPQDSIENNDELPARDEIIRARRDSLINQEKIDTTDVIDP